MILFLVTDMPDITFSDINTFLSILITVDVVICHEHYMVLYSVN